MGSTDPGRGSEIREGRAGDALKSAGESPARHRADHVASPPGGAPVRARPRGLCGGNIAFDGYTFTPSMIDNGLTGKDIGRSRWLRRPEEDKCRRATTPSTSATS